MFGTLKVAAATIALIGAAAAGQAANLISNNFTRVSSGEVVVAPFTDGDGVSTAGSYTGPVELRVSGTGFSLSSLINDAFYFDGGAPTTDFYQLGIGTSAQPLAPFDPSRAGRRLISFIDGIGFVAPNTVPAYSPNHVYSFVIELGGTLTPLSFGVLDGNFGDNGGHFEVTVWQLRPDGAVPEPASWAMLLIGFAGTGLVIRRAPRVAAIG